MVIGGIGKDIPHEQALRIGKKLLSLLPLASGNCDQRDLTFPAWSPNQRSHASEACISPVASLAPRWPMCVGPGNNHHLLVPPCFADLCLRVYRKPTFDRRHFDG